jgi:hypothetical protein
VNRRDLMTMLGVGAGATLLTASAAEAAKKKPKKKTAATKKKKPKVVLLDEKGLSLTPSEMDANFAALRDVIDRLDWDDEA